MRQTEIAFDAFLGRLLRDAGMAQVEDNSGDWKTVARRQVDAWFESTPSGTQFIGEDIRNSLQAAGLESPHHANAWSAVIGSRIRVWLKTGQIQIDGWKAASDPRAHARRMIAYRKIG